ncbi:MAG: hypothetical protein Q9188_005380 [Gyalolechia gomerana]
MSSSSNPASEQKSGAIKNEEVATGASSMASLSEALPFVQPAVPSKKRQASGTPQGIKFSWSDFHQRKKAAIEASAGRAAQGPSSTVPALNLGPSSALPTAIQVPSTQHAEEMEVDRFPFNKIPFSAQESRCAFGIIYSKHQTSVGGVTRSPVNWTATINVNAGRVEFPQIVFAIHVAKEPSAQEFKLWSGNHDSWELTWYAATHHKKGGLMVGKDFSFAPYTEWLQTVPEEKRQESFTQEPEFKAHEEKIWTMSATLCCPKVKDFQDPASKAKLPERIIREMGYLIEQSVPVRFWFQPKKNNTQFVHLPLFSRRVQDNIGILAQYLDTDGKSTLTSVLGVPTIEQVGDGMYKRENLGSYAYLPHAETFHNTAQFSDYASLMVIRKAQYTVGRHAYIARNMLPCFIMPVPDFPWSSAKTGTTEEQKKVANCALVFVRLPSGDGNRMSPEAGLQAMLEWDNGNELHGIPHQSRGNSATLRGITVPRPRSEFTATQTDFCILIQRRPGHSLPELHQRAFHKKVLPRAQIDIVFSPDPLQRELTAIKAFCASQKAECVNIRHALMNGGSENPRRDPPVDVGLLHPPSTGKPRNFDVKIDLYSKASGVTTSQKEVLQKLRNIENSVLAVEGPPGAGKTKILTTTIWPMLATGSKLVVCTASNGGLDNVAIQTHNVRPQGLHGKKLLRLETASREKSSIIREVMDETFDPSKPVPGPHVVDPEHDPRVEAAYADLLAEHATNATKFAEFEADLKRWAGDVNMVRQYENFNAKVSDIPWYMTMGGHIQLLMREDAARAEAQYQEAKAATPNPADHVNIPSADDRNPSKEYARYYEYYMERKGQIGGEGRKAFFKLRGEMERRVYAAVDCFSGREALVVIVDFVAADILPQSQNVRNGVSGKPPVYTKVPSFVRDPHRINLAFTRARDGLIAVGQAALSCDRAASTKGKIGNTLMYLVRDAINRGLLYRELNFRDTHPTAQETERKIHSLAFIAKIIQRNHKSIEAKTEELPD